MEGHHRRPGPTRRRSIYVGGRGHSSLGSMGPFGVPGAIGGAPAGKSGLGPRLVVFAVAALLLWWVVSSVASCAARPAALSDTGLSGEMASEPLGPTVSFVAVGDNLPEKTLGAYADSLAGETGDGTYDYRPIYAPVRSYIEGADLAFVSQEVHLGGDDLGVQGYPSFNAPDDLADALVDTGFDLVASASNHCYDWGNFGAVEHSRELWNTKPVAFTGTATSQEEADSIPVVEREGITFALLDYTYGLNGFEPDDIPSYAVSFLDEDRIRSQVAQAHELADVVVVAAHWGTEKQMEPDEQQLAYAQLFADLGVDIVLGSHPHVIGPVEWVEGSGGHKTLVAYALGDFKSTHDTPHLESELAGMLACDFVREPPAGAEAAEGAGPDEEGAEAPPDAGAAADGVGDDGATEQGPVTIQNVRWIPLVNHIEDGAHAVYALANYNDELVARHTFLSTQDNPLQWMRDTTEQVVHSRGADIPIEI